MFSLVDSRVHRFPANLFYLRINVERRCIKFPIYNVFPHRLALNQAVTRDRRIVVRIESSHVGAENIVVRAKKRESVSFRVPLLNSTRETRFSFFLRRFFATKNQVRIHFAVHRSLQVRRDRPSSRSALAYSSRKNYVTRVRGWIHR